MLLAASAEAEGFHKPSIDDFFPGALAFLNTPLEMNRIMMVRVIMTLLLVVIFSIGASRARLVPGRFQGALEMILDFVRVNIAEEIIGEKRAKPYTPILTVIFLGVLFMNISGVIPGLQIAGTSLVGMPIVFAVVSYIVFFAAGLKAHHGAGGFFKSQLLPAGVPPFLYILIAPIEFLSTFIMRPVTLTIRLLANMISGHLLLVLCFVSTNYLFFEISGWLKGLGVLTLGVGIAFVFFEMFVAVLQAYIFALLTAVYIDSSISSH
nr:F0F1 ATP synthase subunit A [Actinomyces vulturis]